MTSPPKHPTVAAAIRAAELSAARVAMREAARVTMLAAERSAAYGMRSANVEKQAAGIIAGDALRAHAAMLSKMADDPWWFDPVPLGEDDPTEPNAIEVTDADVIED
jgi:hypothetical protein